MISILSVNLKPAIQLDKEPAIIVREPDATIQPTLQDNQLMSKHRVLSFKPQLRLMARPGWPERNRAARSFRQLWRFDHVINSDKVFGTHRYECRGLGEAGAVRPWQFGAFP